MTESDRIVGAVTREVGLIEGTRGVRAVLTALARLEPVSIRVLARAVDLPVPIVAAICRRAPAARRRRRRAPGTADGRRPPPVRPRRFARPRHDVPGVRRAGDRASRERRHLRRGLARVAEAAPNVRTELDQCHCTPKTMLRRVLALHAAGAIAGRRIMLLGDDDLISLALARFVTRFGSAR